MDGSITNKKKSAVAVRRVPCGRSFKVRKSARQHVKEKGAQAGRGRNFLLFSSSIVAPVKRRERRQYRRTEIMTDQEAAVRGPHLLGKRGSVGISSACTRYSGCTTEASCPSNSVLRSVLFLCRTRGSNLRSAKDSPDQLISIRLERSGDD